MAKTKRLQLAGDRNRQRGSRIAECCGVEHQMRAAAGPQPDRRVDLAGPHTGRVDHRTGRHVERLAGALIGQPHRRAGDRRRPRRRSGSARRAGRRCVRRRRPAGRRRSAGRRRPADRRRGRRAAPSGTSSTARSAVDPPGSRQRRGAACRPAGAARHRRGSRSAPAPRCRGPSTAAAAPAAASPAPGEERCASSGFRVRPRCAGRCRRCRSPGSAARRGPACELHRLVPNARSCFSTSATDSPRDGGVQRDTRYR